MQTTWTSMPTHTHTYTHTHTHCIFIRYNNFDIPSSDTNCPITEAPPAAFSWNWISETMSCSSSTAPQFVQTLSPRVASSSISLHWQCLHTRSGMMLQFSRFNAIFPITVIFFVVFLVVFFISKKLKEGPNAWSVKTYKGTLTRQYKICTNLQGKPLFEATNNG